MSNAKFKYELQELQRGLAELELREQHPLKVYRPTPQQLPVHESSASEVITVGGKRCLAPWQTIYDPMYGIERRVDSITESFAVRAKDPKTGRTHFAEALRPFTKGEGDFYEFTLSNGNTITTTADHQVLTLFGWMSFREACERQQECGHGLLVSSEDTSLSRFPRDARRSKRRFRDSRGRYLPCRHPYGGRLHLAAGSGLAFSPSPVGARGLSLIADERQDDLGSTQECSPTYQHASRRASPCAPGQTSGLSDAFECQVACTPYSQPSGLCRAEGRFLRLSYAQSRTADAAAQRPSESYYAEPLLASVELAVSVTDVRYIGKHTVWDFEVPKYGNYICAGVVNHNSGKTLAVAMEFASRLLGIPITREDGTVIPLRFRKPTRKNPGLYWVIGLNVDHIGQTLYHRLFSDGLGCNFRIIRDGKTGEWRAYNPNTDKHRYEDSKLSPPLFGDYLIKQDSWHFESRAGNVFKSVRILDDAVTLCAYPTTGDNPKQGDAVDGIWLDEDTANASFLKEWQDRLISVRGWFLWSVWPKVANEALIKTLDRAKKYEEEEKKPIQVIQLIGSENPYSDKEGIAEGLARMDDDDDAAHRDRGDIEAFISGRRMYDFGDFHIVKATAKEEKENPLHIIQDLLHKQRRLPPSWTRYLVIDPSHTRTACLFGVVPPPEWDGIEMGNRLIVEQELVVRKHTPTMFADALKPFMDHNYEAFIMDQMIGRQTTVGSDATVFQIYEEQFRRRGFESRLTRSGFMRGSNDKSLRRRTVRDFLEPKLGGLPTLFVSHRCTQTIREFYNFRKKELKDNTGQMVPLDDAANERVFDCMAAIEYLSQYVAERFRDGTAYVEPERRQGKGSLAFHSAMGMIKQMNLEAGGSYVHFGPGASV